LLTHRRAARLARRAARRRGGGSRGLLARLAWRALARADEQDGNAAMGVWQVWLASPDDEAWDLLARRPGQVDRRAQALAVAVDPGRPAASRAAIGAFCAAREMAPGDPVERALFFVLTGRHAQHRAADPDGSLLAAAYRAADEPTRAAVREELAGAGDLDLVRVVAGGPGPGRRPALTADESGYLVGQLAGRRDWAGLWRLAPGLPLAEAVAAVARFGDGWQPADDRGRALFRRLARMSPAEIAGARAALDPVLIQIDGTIVRGSISPDGRWLAVATLADSSIDLFELPAGTLAMRYDNPGFHPRLLLHLGDALLAAGHSSRTFAWEQFRYSRSQAEALWQDRVRAEALALHPDGFVALCADPGRVPYHLRFCEPGGRPAWSVSLHDLGVPEALTRLKPRLVAADPASGRLALYLERFPAARRSGYERYLWVLETRSGHARVLARCMAAEPTRSVLGGEPVSGACFIGPERLVVGRKRDVRLYQLSDRGVRRLASTPVPDGNVALIAIPARHETALLDSIGRVKYLDERTLTRVRAPREFTGRSGRDLWGTPDGRLLALAGNGNVEVVLHPLSDTLAALADRPLASLAPGDIATVTGALRDTAAGWAARPLLEVLAACLEYRFGDELALGAAAPVQAAADDVALASSGGRPC
jgi:hypothetical protein